MNNNNSTLLVKTASAYFEYGVLGVTVVVLLIVTALLIWYILRDNKNDAVISDSISLNAKNQEKFIIMYEESQKQHKEIVSILTETLEIERANTKECYLGVGHKLDTLHNKLDNFIMREK